MAETLTFGEWVQAELNSRGWDQAELARRSNISDAHISRLVTGGRQPGQEAAKAIARALRLPPEDVMRQAGILPPKNVNLAPGDRRAFFDTVDKLAALSPDAQRLIADLVDKVWRSEQQ
jgi:transcriptional regulator with XRE-family HTH domain